MNTHPILHPHPPLTVASGGGRRKKRQQRDSEHNSPFGVATMTGANRSESAAVDGARGFHSPPETTVSGNCLDFSPPIGRTVLELRLIGKARGESGGDGGWRSGGIRVAAASII
ncbi:unnamed protein product [Lactuca saligna]|uniref:Uncharacterized protein n=1 Tax=Lactuca saligna TaxID=75948 RepID=A0AA35YZ71_LACSI|nr:unnamed protein product [Lactuca saligna]